jgi:hypothetical protein
MEEITMPVGPAEVLGREFSGWDGEDHTARGVTKALREKLYPDRRVLGEETRSLA